MSATNVKGPGGKKPASAATNLIGKDHKNSRIPKDIYANLHLAGGGAGMMEALVCHPLGTKVHDSQRNTLDS
jgi:solute carrier family 25 (mitochondrial citrate transporter), member 1